MDNVLRNFEALANRLGKGKLDLPDTVSDANVFDHPFDSRNIHPEIDKVSRGLFDDGHYKNATVDACIKLEEAVKSLSENTNIGFSLMMEVFNEKNPQLDISDLSGDSRKNEQRGLRHMFAGVMAGIRNPRSHQTSLSESMPECLDHLSVVSFLMRKLDNRP